MGAKETRTAMLNYVMKSEDFLYSAKPDPKRQVRFVFKNKTCFGLTEAFNYAKSLEN